MLDSDARHRRSIRLPGYDYTSEGAYFVTVVCQNRELLFTDERMKAIVDEAWRWLAVQYEHVEIDQYVVMPNHFHGVVVITDRRRGGSRTAPTGARNADKPLGRLIGAFKTVSTKRINILRDSPGVPVWQRNYYERVVRNEAELNRIRQYILDNPARWHEDPENPVVSPVRRASR